MSKHLWVTDAEQGQKGGFCDARSKIHYLNLSRAEMDDAIAISQEHGSDITDLRDERDVMVVDDGQMTSAKAVAARNNCTILEVDGQSFDYPAKHGPGN